MPPVNNRGRLINFVTGITGVSAGGQAVINMPVNLRYHRLIFQCKAVNYTTATGSVVPLVNITGAGVSGTATVTIVNGQVTAAVVAAGGSGYVVGNQLRFADPTGTGVILTVATVSSGAILTMSVTSGGTASAINPALFMTSLRLLVNGINMRDISVANVLAISQINGYVPVLGELPIFFTSPWRNVNFHNEVNSWDMFGQSTFSLQIAIAANMVNPSLIGVQEFDYFRNTKPSEDGKTVEAFLQPVSQHQFSLPIIAGRNDINTLPYSYPISRMWIYGSSAGQLSQLEIYQDNNKILEATTEQLQQSYTQYGFTFNPAGSVTVPNGSLSGPAFDAAYISDPDQRYWKALKVQNSLVVRAYSNVAQTLTIVQETLPGAYSA